jgi:ABC-type multidrug transport system fused ATPase/permease subunit
MKAVGASEKVFSLMDREPKIKHDAGEKKPDLFKGHIHFKNVSFNYPTRPDSPVLKVNDCPLNS